jgi:hypothetical protein
MGLDILLGANNQAALDAGDFKPSDHRLSRNFCALMCRQNDFEGASELDQIGQMTGVDISPLSEMTHYMLPEDVAGWLECEQDPAERKRVTEQAEAAAAAIAGNLNRVTVTVQVLLTQLALFDDLPSRLLPVAEKPFREAGLYFTSFASLRMNQFDNTFGQDLRNLKVFLDYAKSKRSQTVFFVFG